MFAHVKSLSSFSKNDHLDKINQLKQELLNVPPDFSKITVEFIQHYLTQIKILTKATYDDIANLEGELTFSKTIQPLIDLDIITQKIKSLCIFPMDMSTNEEVRKASTNAKGELEKFDIECGQRLDVFQVLRKYESSSYQHENKHLHSEQIIYFQKLMVEYKRNGLYIADAKTREIITQIKKEIADLSVKFDENVNEDKTSFLMTKQELAGLSEDWFTAEREASPGIYKVTLKYPDVVPILDFATNRETRKKIFCALNSCCEKENTPILKEILILRQKLAQLLGYKNHAEFAEEVRMVKTADTVKAFLHDMNQRFTPLLDSNLKELTLFAREKEKNNDFIIEQYDIRYYVRLREEALCNVDIKEIQKYFPLEKVIGGTLQIYEKLLSLKFVRTSNQTAWHNDVFTFDVYNYDDSSQTSGEKIGSFYLDLHPREGKYSHAAVWALVKSCDISHLSQKPNDKEKNIAGMLCNFPKNENMPFDDVVTFFHEFGHVMHFVCSQTKLATCHAGFVELDFIEAPSQMLENWCYEPAVLQILSSHVDTQQPLPQAIATKLRDKNKIHAGYINKRQLVFGYFDLLIHCMSVEEIKNLDIKMYFHHIQNTILPLPTLTGTCFPASFGHIVNGYDAGYYGYMISKTYAADMYDTVFKKDPLSPQAGARYRKYILEPGSSRDAMDSIQQFLGRAPKLDAFLEMSGLNQETKKEELAKSTEEKTTLKV